MARLRPHRVASIAIASVIALLHTQVAMAVAPSYAGWVTTSNWKGVAGYMRQSTTVPILSSQVHFMWLNLCASGCGQWVQTGTYQGAFAGGTSLGSVHVYYENVDPCGSYYVDDLGAPVAADYKYFISLYSGPQNFTCANGVPFQGYTFAYRMGSSTSPPYFFGVMSANSGPAYGNTELQGSPLPTINTDYFGCSPTFDCNNPDYGFRLYDGTWHTWTSSLASSFSFNGNPPYLHTYNNYWAFKTCRATC